MSILIIGDLHFKLDNTFQCEQLYKHVEEILSDDLITHVILLGDVLHDHEKIHSTVLTRVVAFVKMISTKVKVTILVGNHDMVNNQVFCDPNGNWMNVFLGWGNVCIVDVPQYVLINQIKIAAVPYVHVGRFQEALDKYNIKLDTVSFCVAHQEFKGCKMGAIESVVGDEYTSDTPCYSGHIHSAQKVGNVTYTGSAFEHSFGSPKCWLYFVNEKSLKITRIAVKVDSKRTLYTDLKRVDGVFIIDLVIPQDATKQLTKCTIKIDQVQDYVAWLQTSQGIEISRRTKLGYTLRQPEEKCDKKPKELDVFAMYKEIVRKKHPECVALMSTIGFGTK